MPVTRRELIAGVGGMLGVVLLRPRADISLGGRKPAVDMPVSLAVGTVRTPEFPVKREPYLIIIRAERRLSLADMNCMMGLTTGPLDSTNCDKEPLLQADWTTSRKSSRHSAAVSDPGVTASTMGSSRLARSSGKSRGRSSSESLTITTWLFGLKRERSSFTRAVRAR